MTPKQARKLLKDIERWKKLYGKVTSLHVCKIGPDRYTWVSLN